jgi:hypothetical protein
MLGDLLIGGGISLINFGIHALTTVLIVAATRRLEARTQHLHSMLRVITLLMIAVTVLMLAHVAEISVWASYMALAGVRIANAGIFEFAFENYTALGYGDALPDGGRRLIGPVMALNGLLLIGWSVAVIFEVLRMAEIEFGPARNEQD